MNPPKSFSKWFSTWIVAFSSLIIHQSSATTFAPQPFQTTIEQAPVIIHGKAGMHYSDWGKGPENSKQIFTYYEIQVLETLKGNTPSSSITIRELGGEKEGLGMQIEGTSHYERGEDVVVLLRNQNSEGSYDVHGMMMGKYNVNVDSNGQEYLSGPGLFATSDSPRWTLDALRKFIKSQNHASTPSPSETPSALPSYSSQTGQNSNLTSNVENHRQPAAPQLQSQSTEDSQHFREVPFIVWIGVGALGIGCVYAFFHKRKKGKWQ